MKKSYLFRIIIKSVRILACSVFVGFLLLFSVYLLPVEPMRENVKESISDFHEEGSWHTLIDGYRSTTIDNFTDSIMLSEAIYDNNESPIIQSVKNYYACKSLETLPIDSLVSYLEDESTCFGENYARYWHGYLIILKPLLLFFNYYELRLLNTFLLTLLTAYTFYLLTKHISKGVGISFITSVLFLVPLTLYFCLDLSNMFYLTLFAIIILINKKVFFQKEDNILYFFLILGVITAYMDFLTYPIITWGIPSATYIAMEIYHYNKPPKAGRVLLLSILWVLGYGGMWASKWVLATLISGENIIYDALRTIKTRSDLRDEGLNLAKRMLAITENTKVLCNGVLGILLVLFITVFLLYFLRFLKRQKSYKKCAWILIFIAMIPFIWIFLTSEHTLFHAWFTYRNLIISVYAFGIFCTTSKVCCSS